MAFALAKENEAFIERMIEVGRFNNQSEVVREALRRMEREENSYLNPPPLNQDQLNEIYKADPEAERNEHIAGHKALKGIRRVAKARHSIEEL